PDDLMQYVDRELPRERRGEVAEHLAWCALCREDVDDYGRERARMQPHRGIWIAAAAAAAVRIAVLAAVFYPRPEEAHLKVEVRAGPSTTILPAPPRPPALFRIVDEATANELAEAARRFPDDHLLLGVLYARAGVQWRAAEELAQAASPAAAKIAASIRNW